MNIILKVPKVYSTKYASEHDTFSILFSQPYPIIRGFNNISISAPSIPDDVYPTIVLNYSSKVFVNSLLCVI